MKYFAAIAAAAAFVPGALGHYRWVAFVNGGRTGDYEFVRQNTNHNSPVENVMSTDMRCNVGTQANAGKTGVAKVAAGSTVGMALDQAIYHQGVSLHLYLLCLRTLLTSCSPNQPILIYMSRAPGDVKSYDGSGDWFKVAQRGPGFNSQGADWVPTSVGQFDFKIPASLPAGQYLIRAEHIGLHVASSQGGAQIYIGCAQVEVTGGGSGSPGPLVKFPGAYSPTDPGIMMNIYYPPMTSYKMPGPAVWSG